MTKPKTALMTPHLDPRRPSGQLRKTTVTVDEAAARSAQEELGTTTLTATVNAALREIAARAARRRFVARLSKGEGIDLADPEVMRSAWR